MTEVTTEQRQAALALHLQTDVDDLRETAYGEHTFEGVGGHEYRVLTDDEADEAALDSIRESVWAFVPSFLAEQTGLPQEAFEAFAKSGMCEYANAPILAMIEHGDGIEAFAQVATDADGRGHFLSGWDGEEAEVETEDGVTLFVYVN